MIFKNGNVAVFDDNEEQVGWLQGQWKEQHSLVFSQVDSETKWFDERYEL